MARSSELIVNKNGDSTESCLTTKQTVKIFDHTLPHLTHEKKTTSKPVFENFQQFIRYGSLHELDEQGVMINLIESFKQIDGTYVYSTSLTDLSIMFIAAYIAWEHETFFLNPN